MKRSRNRCHVFGKILIWGLVGFLVLGQIPCLAAKVAASRDHYLQAALINGQQVQRWNDSTRSIYINIVPGYKIKGWSPKYASYVKDAFSEWQRALNGRLRFVFTTDPRQTDIMVSWRLKSNGFEVGNQGIRWNNNTLTNADIELAMRNPNGQQLTELEMRHVALHEIGHALGIRGHSNSPTDIMYPSVQPNVVHLSPRDVKTMRMLYQMKPHVTNPEGVHLLQFRMFEYYYRLAFDAFQEKRYGQALQDFQIAQSYYSKDNRIAFLIGLSAYNSKKYDVAIKQLKASLLIAGPHRMDAEYYLASAFMVSGSQAILAGNRSDGTGRFNQARLHYQNVLKSPQTSQATRKLAMSDLNKLNTAMASL